MRIIFTLLFTTQIFSLSLFAQEIVPYYDANSGKWGFHTKDFNKIMIEAKYDDATAWYKDFGIVMIDGKYGMVDRKGNKVSPFILDYLSVENCVSCKVGELYGVYFYKNHLSGDRKFYVNEKCDCIPYSYWPCPPMVKIDTSSTPKNLKLLQRAEYLYHQGEITKSLIMADRAIAADTNDASAYFWKASVMSDNYWMIISEDPYVMENDIEIKKDNWKKEYETKFTEIEKLLELNRITADNYNRIRDSLIHQDSLFEIEFKKTVKKADSLNKYYSKWEDEALEYINVNYDKDFAIHTYYNKALSKEPKDTWAYKSLLAGKYEIKYISKAEKKSLKKELRNSVERKYRKSNTTIMFNLGYSIFPYQYFEANITFGYADFMYDNLFPFVAAVGLGFEKGINFDLESYKAIVMIQPIGPIHLALNVLFNKNTITHETGFGIRPEFGFNISSFTILYGYNITKEDKFPIGAVGNKVGLRFNFPLWRPNEFSKEWGNNFFRY